MKPGGQRNKGKVGERQACKLLTRLGYPARRGAQHRGGPDSPDVVCPSLAAHFEVKFTPRMFERKVFEAACNQARQERAGDEPWAVLWKADRQWRMTFEGISLIVTVTGEAQIGKALERWKRTEAP